MADEIESILIEKASTAKTVTVDGTTVTERDARDLIELDRYLASKAAVKSPKRGFNLSKFSPPGTV